MNMDLLMVCLSSFAAVFTILIVIALVMRLITEIFPDPAADGAPIEAVRKAYAEMFPGVKITSIRELD